MKNRSRLRLICIVSVLACCVTVLQGCGKDSSAPAEAGDSGTQMIEEMTVTETEETDLINGTETVTTAAEITGSVSADNNSAQDPDEDADYVPADTTTADYSAAKAVAERYLEAYKSGDADTVFEITMIDDLIQTMTEYQDTTLSGSESSESLEDIKQRMREQLIEESKSFASYTYKGSYEIPGYQKQVDELLAELDERLEEVRKSEDPTVKERLPEFERQTEMTRKILSFDKVYFFDYDLNTASGEANQEILAVIHKENGWYLDLSIMPAMIGYVSKSKLVSANSNAKSVYHAFQSALTDMEELDYHASDLEGTHIFKGSDFVNVSKPVNAETKEEKMQFLLYQVSQYYSQITEIDEISVEITGDVCSAIAIQNGEISSVREGRQTLFGTYPNMMQKEDLGTVKSLSDALKYAEVKYNGG
ncbi:MAG: hypothetical protein IKI58_12230 [Oscillospiraceae bacterium]|nr:hypothetical protein [Oscillospiraceae bacterium]